MAVARDLAAALDPTDLAGRAGLVLDPWQRDVLLSASKRILLNCSRQAGKSSILAVKALHVSIYEPRSLVLLISKSQRQSQELFKVVSDLYRRLGKPVAPEFENLLSLQMENGSRIVSLPSSPDTVRGFAAVRLIAIDEAAQVGDDMYRTIRPMLIVSGGALIAASTPYGRRGWWSDEWHGGAEWDRYRVPWHDVPRLPAHAVEADRRAMGDWWWRQEYLCEFMDPQTQAFSTEAINRMLDPDVGRWPVLGNAWAA